MVELAHGDRSRVLKGTLILQRQFQNWVGKATFIVAAARVGLTFAAPAGPVQAMLALLPGQQQHRQQAPHLGDGEGDQVAVIPPFAPL